MIMKRWTFSTQNGYARNEELWLYPELSCSSMVDEYHDEPGDIQMQAYVRYLEQKYPEYLAADAVPIYWSVQPVCETAPFQKAVDGLGVDRHFLSYYTWPVDAAGTPLDWYSLPVRNDRFPDFAAALNWTPSPLQPSCPLASILRNRR